MSNAESGAWSGAFEVKRVAGQPRRADFRCGEQDGMLQAMTLPTTP